MPFRWDLFAIKPNRMTGHILSHIKSKLSQCSGLVLCFIKDPSTRAMIAAPHSCSIWKQLDAYLGHVKAAWFATLLSQISQLSIFTTRIHALLWKLSYCYCGKQMLKLSFEQKSFYNSNNRKLENRTCPYIFTFFAGKTCSQ